MKMAVIGSGIAGMAAADALRRHAHVTLFEAADSFGGHAHTVDVTLPDAAGREVTHGVDTGFLVFNERTYPGLIALLGRLGVDSTASDMSFSVQVPERQGQSALAWSGSNLNTVFAQRRNLLSRPFWGMLRDVLRFNRLCTQLALDGDDQQLFMPLDEFLNFHGFGAAFRNWYFLPMLGCIWSCPTDQMLRFPVATMVRFCHNHGLLQVSDRPQWFTVTGGSQRYVNALLGGLADKRLNTPVRSVVRAGAGVQIVTDSYTERFDHVVLATHTDQALALLHHPSRLEQKVLGAIAYQPNRAVLHTDVSVLPRQRRAWAAWNYERAPQQEQEASRVCLHYWINRLQALPFARDVVVSLNPVRAIDPALVLGEYDYAHPVFDLAAMQAQRRLDELQGQQRTWFCGAWAGYGFHEDGLQSGLRTARTLLAQMHAPLRAAA